MPVIILSFLVGLMGGDWYRLRIEHRQAKTFLKRLESCCNSLDSYILNYEADRKKEK